ncbi:MAG: helix-turn-helix domain-containing protein [Patescibacteria group bacterium]
MKNLKRKLQLEQLDKKIKAFNKLESFTPSNGWVYATRMALDMSMEQLGKIMGITTSSVSEIEQREREGGISLNSLNEVARAFGLKLTYGFSAPGKSLEKIINERALLIARDIVSRTNVTMNLEKQANSKSRLRKAIKDRAAEIAEKNSKYLWD